jgi:hypothetical protein
MEQVKDVDYDFVFFNGDCIDDPNNRAQASRFIKHVTEALKGDQVPTFFMRGNHEIRNAYSIGLRDHFDYVGGKTYGAFNWGDTRIVMLDCGEDKTDDHKEYSGLNDFTQLRQEQVGFLQEELASKAFKKADYDLALPDKLPFQRWDAGIGFRVGAEYNQHYNLMFGCDWGLADIYRDKLRDQFYEATFRTTSLPKVKNFNFSITFGYRF